MCVSSHKLSKWLSEAGEGKSPGMREMSAWVVG